MLPEAGATELIFLAAVALIVVGPKDLPVLMRKVGQWVAKMRNLAAEFRSSFDELARQSELDELRKEVEALRNARMPDPLAELHPTFEELNGLNPSGYAMSADPHPAEVTPHPEAEGPAAEPAPAAPKPAAKPRSPRKPKAAATATDAGPVKTRKAPAKPRARRASTTTEADG